jgi:ADP-heptose:LPS heptosyltransferase
MKPRVLVIRHGALGDIVLSFPAFAAIRATRPDAEISLLTTAPFAGWLGQAPWFDRVVTDAKPGPFDIAGLINLRRTLRGFDMVYDLQTSGRSSRYFRLADRPRWSGIAPGCAFPHADPARDNLHSRERIEGQLAAAGILHLPDPDLGWTVGEPPVALPERFVALVPGAAPHRPEKRWPEQKFGELAASLDLPCVILGSRAEQKLAAEIAKRAPTAIDLTGRTTLPQLAGVLARAALAVGNDTGPMHLAAALGTRSIVLFGGASDPALTAPRYPDGGWPTVLRKAELAGLAVADVAAAVQDGHNDSSFMRYKER